MKTISYKKVLITGAGAGIGQALAVAFAKHNCDLALCDINSDQLKETERLCRQHLTNSSQIVCAQLDTSDRESVYQFASKLKEEFTELNILINNAGISMGEVTIEDLEYEDLDRIMDINFKGMVYFNKAFLPMMSRNESSIVNVSSIFGLIGSKFSAAYVASKFAIHGFTQVLRFELLDTGITVHSVFPAGIKTNISQNALKKELRNPEFEKNLTITSDQAANIIIKGIRRKQERIRIGKEAYFVDWASRLFPAWAPKMINKYFIKR